MSFSKLFILIAVVLVTACSKHEAITENKPQDNKQPGDSTLTGTWQWVRTDGGIGYNIHETPASTGKQILLKLAPNGTYAYTTNGAVSSEGTYTVQSTATATSIDFSTDQDMIVERVDGNELLLSDGFADGVAHLYQRQDIGSK